MTDIHNMVQSIDQFDPAYLVTLDEIYHSHWVAQKKQRIAFLREVITHCWPNGHPSQLIQIAGTNGKGSVAYYLEQGLQSVSRSGSWTGPHLFDYAERFHVNGQQVAHQDIVTAYEAMQTRYQAFLQDKYENVALNFIEIGILMTLHLFEQYEVKWGIIEVSCGGRYTPSMALDTVACVLTNVGNDHLASLGTELWQRAMDKAGIARPGVPFFTAEMAQALPYVMKTAETAGANIIPVDQIKVDQVRTLQPETPEFKLRNLALATEVIRYFYPDLTLDQLLKCMAETLPGRFAQVAPNLILDVAHNPDKIARLSDELKRNHPDQQFWFLIGLTRQRDVRNVFAPILSLAKGIVVTGASYDGQDPESLAQQLRLDFPNVVVAPDPKTAYEQTLKRLAPAEILVITGSAYLIDQVMNPNPYLRHLNATYGWRALSLRSK